jgi:prophage antirepressor-like protein
MTDKALTTIPFYFDGAEVRAVVVDGAPHFIGNDVARRLGYANPGKAMRDHCKGGPKWTPLQTTGGVQKTRILDRPDVMRLIINSQLPAAQRFERWVFEEVLPEIMTTGSYAGRSDDRSAEHLEVISGIVEVAISKANAERDAKMEADIKELKARVETALAGFDETQTVVTNFFSTFEILLDCGVTDNRGRGGLSSSCTSLLKKWCTATKKHDAFHWSEQRERWLFRRDVIGEWLRAEGYVIIRAHKDKIAGQGILHLVPKSNRQRPADANSAY